jgi:hypothetical protein
VTRRTAPAAALTAAALILLTACGGGGGDEGSDKITSTHPAVPTSASPPVSASPTAARPELALLPGTSNTFDPQRTGDAVKDEVLADNAFAVDSVDSAITAGKNRTPGMEFYYGGAALRGAVDFVQGYLSKGDTWVGTTRYFDRAVALKNDGSAVIVYCSDETRSYLKSRSTGKIAHASGSADDYVLYDARLQKNSQGIWITVSLLSNRSAKQCQP